MHSDCREMAAMAWDKSVPSAFTAGPEQVVIALQSSEGQRFPQDLL